MRHLALGLLVSLVALSCVRTTAGLTSTAIPNTAAADTASPGSDLFRLVRAEYSGDSALATVAFVERFWRVPGNTGFDSSIVHVVSTLRRAGWVEEGEATAGQRLTYRVERHPMNRPTWEPDDASLHIVGQREPVLSFATNRHMIAINSWSTPASGVEAEVVDVGKGAESDFARVDVAGKVVLGEMRVGPLFTEAVQKRGAVGVLAYSMPGYTQPTKHVNSIQFGSIPVDSAKRAWGVVLSHEARERLRTALAAGPVRVRVTARTRIWHADELMLVADARGNSHPHERFVFSAHVQEPGANDNASGVGAQAEMARVLASLVRAGRVDPARTITMIWGDEIRSTQRYLRQDSARTAGVRWGVSLDMVGQNTDLTGGTFLIEKMPDPSAVWTRGDDSFSEWGGKPLHPDSLTPHWFNDFVLHRALDQAAVTGWVVRTNPFEGGSDHVPFLTAGKPGLLFWHFTDVYYHTDGDRLRNVSPRTLANVGATALVSALTLATADGATARAITAETERAAVQRLDREVALSLEAVAAGGERALEEMILRAWTTWYRDAIRHAAEIEPGGPSSETRRAIEAAAARVEKAGEERVARIRAR